MHVCVCVFNTLHIIDGTGIWWFLASFGIRRSSLGRGFGEDAIHNLTAQVHKPHYNPNPKYQFPTWAANFSRWAPSSSFCSSVRSGLMSSLGSMSDASSGRIVKAWLLSLTSEEEASGVMCPLVAWDSTAPSLCQIHYKQ